MANLYERIGGEAAVNAAVEVFYRKVLKDDRIKGFFDDVDMDRQLAKQKAFLTMAFGGPAHYSGQDLRSGHAHLVKRGLNDGHFDAVAQRLQETLQELGVGPAEISEVMAIAGGTRAFIEDGDKVKVTLRFRGREMAHQDLGVKVLERIRTELGETVKVEQMPRLENRQMIMVLAPK